MAPQLRLDRLAQERLGHRSCAQIPTEYFGDSERRVRWDITAALSHRRSVPPDAPTASGTFDFKIGVGKRKVRVTNPGANRGCHCIHECLQQASFNVPGVSAFGEVHPGLIEIG